jgi:hypothetical protein
MMIEILCLVFLFSGLTWLFIGAPILGVGVSREGYISTRCLTSIPLCPTSGSAVTDYVGRPLAATCVVPSSGFNVSIPLRKSQLTAEAGQTAYLLHNLWAYDFTVHVCDTNGECLAGEFSRQRNLLQVGDGQSPTMCNLADIPAGIVSFGRATVACPLDTLATRDIAAGCAAGGWPADLDWPLQQLELGSVDYSLIATDPILIVFESLTAVPMTWIDVPQMYWVSWEKITTQTMVIVGVVFTVLGGFITLLGFSFLLRL